MTTTAEHLRNTLDGRWRDVKNRVREELSTEIFKPHYTPNTVIARTKVGEQLKSLIFDQIFQHFAQGFVNYAEQKRLWPQALVEPRGRSWSQAQVQ